jgi:hypothetical protein
MTAKDDRSNGFGQHEVMRVIPGRGWGPLVVGAKLVAVERELGAPSHRRQGSNYAYADWRPLGVRVYMDLAGTITSVGFIYRQIYDQELTAFTGVTDRGIGASSTLADVEAAYGPAPEKRGNKGDCLVYPGTLFSFEDGQLHEISIADDIVPKQCPELPPPKPPNATSARVLELVAALERRLANHPKLKLVFTRCEPAWLENFERREGCRLPPSYRELVLSKGTISVEWAPRRETFMMIPVADLGGPEPTSWVDEGDDEIDANIARSIFFAYESDDAVENFYAFDPESVDDDGEMLISTYWHDERFESDGGNSFADYIEFEIANLFKSFDS